MEPFLLGVDFSVSAFNKENAILLGGPRGRKTKIRCWMVARRTHVLGRELQRALDKGMREYRAGRQEPVPENGGLVVAPDVELAGISKFHTTRAYRAIAGRHRLKDIKVGRSGLSKLAASFELSSRMEGLLRIVFPIARAKGHTFECRPRAQVGSGVSE